MPKIVSTPLRISDFAITWPVLSVSAFLIRNFPFCAEVPLVASGPEASAVPSAGRAVDARLLGFVFRLTRFLRLPLHIARIIRAAALERYYVIDHVAGTGADGLPVDGHGRPRWNEALAAGLRLILPCAFRCTPGTALLRLWWLSFASARFGMARQFSVMAVNAVRSIELSFTLEG